MQKSLSKEDSDKIFAVLGLFQCIAMNNSTRAHFLKANLPLYFYPLINTQVKHKFYDHLKLSSLGVIGALVKGDDSNAIKFIMNTEMIVLCLRIMKKGANITRTVATFILKKILLNNDGLEYVCNTWERFSAICQVLLYVSDDIDYRDKNNQKILKNILV
jgi:CCR4-NOT transcription complex subunit 9